MARALYIPDWFDAQGNSERFAYSMACATLSEALDVAQNEKPEWAVRWQVGRMRANSFKIVAQGDIPPRR